MKINCTVGITAHNEEANIGKLLRRLQEQELQTAVITRIYVVASGCTDNTVGIVQEKMAEDGRIHLLIQENREGKASAINLMLNQQTERVIILCSADLLPEVDVIEKMVAPFANQQLGMTASHPVPVNDDDTFMGFAAHLLWGLHHAINESGGFKAGELIGFIKVFEQIPYRTSVDEASIEPIVRGQGFQVQYVPDAIVYNKGPDRIDDFLRQRRRIHSGHLDVTHLLGYSVSTMNGKTILKSLLKNLDWRPKQFIWTWAVVALEVYGRFLGWRDYKKQRDHTIWEIATTTKELSAKGG